MDKTSGRNLFPAVQKGRRKAKPEGDCKNVKSFPHCCRKLGKEAERAC